MNLRFTDEAATQTRLDLAASEQLPARESAPILNSQDIRDLADVIQREESRRSKLVVAGAGGFVLIAAVLAFISTDLIYSSRDLHALELTLRVGAFFALLGPILLALVLTVPSRRLRTAISAFSRISSKYEINSLFQLRKSIKGPRAGREVHAALTRALLALRASDSAQISKTTYDQMIATLAALPEAKASFSSGTTFEYHLAIVKAMEQIGDERAIKPLERVAGMKGNADIRRRLRQAAQDALPAVKERARRRSAPDTLLRASGSPPPEDLLRPAAGESREDPAHLLRARPASADSAPDSEY